MSLGFRSQSDLPWPSGWHQRPLGDRLPSLVMVLGGSLFLVISLSMIVGGGPVPSAIFVLVVSVLLLLVGFHRWPRVIEAIAQSTHWHVDGKLQPATLLPVRSSSLWKVAILTAIGNGLLLMTLVLIVAALIEFNSGALWGIVIIGPLAGIFLHGAWTVAREKPSAQGVYLTPTHLIISLGHGELLLDWAEVSAIEANGTTFATGRTRDVVNTVEFRVSDSSDARNGERIGRAFVPTCVESPSGRLVEWIPLDRFATDPLVAFHALMFYLNTPARRPELGSDAARNRITTADFHP